jgi:hypothetical protein
MKQLLLFVFAFFVLVPFSFAGQKELMIVWDHNTEPDLAGYKLFMMNGVSEEELVPPVTIPYDKLDPQPPNLSETITVSDGAVTVVCAEMIAFDESLNESERSDRACINVDFEPPAKMGTITTTVKTPDTTTIP